MDPTGETVSVIIPSYRSTKTLAACLDAVFAQTVRPLEVIVVDDASPDGSSTIARRYPCRVIIQPVNRGVSAARNTGAAASRGSVLFFVDADIALAPDALAAALRELAADPSCALVQGIYDREPLFADGRVELAKTLHEHYWRSRAAGVVTVTLFALTAVRRQVFEAIGGFAEELRDGEDIEFGTRLPAGWRIRMSAAVRGRHDDVDRLRPLLREQYRRATHFAGNLVRGWRRGGRGGIASTRTNALTPAGVLSCAATLAGLPTPLAGALATGPALAAALLVLPVLGYAGFLVANRGLLGFVRRDRGAGFAAYVAGLHFLLTAATVVGTAAGLLRLALPAGRRPAPGGGTPARVSPGASR